MFVTISTDKCFLECRLTLIEFELILYFVLILLNCNMKKYGKSRVIRVLLRASNFLHLIH